MFTLLKLYFAKRKLKRLEIEAQALKVEKMRVNTVSMRVAESRAITASLSDVCSAGSDALLSVHNAFLRETDPRVTNVFNALLPTLIKPLTDNIVESVDEGATWIQEVTKEIKLGPNANPVYLAKENAKKDGLRGRLCDESASLLVVVMAHSTDAQFQSEARVLLKRLGVPVPPALQNKTYPANKPQNG